MVVVAVCLVLLAVGLILAIRWSGLPFVAPDPTADPSAAEVARRYAWYVAIDLTAALVVGLTVIGAGGRLAMRLLAVTAGDDAQGRLTEAEEVVGEITVGGTVAFFLFTGLFGGLLLTTVYLVVRRFLPAGTAGGLALGAGFLAVFGATLDPLRRENPDFDIVGPGWLAVAVFAAMAIVFGLALSGTVARLSTWLPLPAWERRTLVRYLPAAVLAVVAFPFTVTAILVGFAVVAVTRWRPVVDATRSGRFVVAGRILVVIAVALGVPTFVASAADIVSR